jgi:hypothetical protein
VKQLPYQVQASDIHIDTYFSSFKLFQHSKGHGVDAFGIVKNPVVLLSALREKGPTKLDWDTRSSFVRDGVLAVLWTTYDIFGPEWEISDLRTNMNGVDIADQLRSYHGTLTKM